MTPNEVGAQTPSIPGQLVVLDCESVSRPIPKWKRSLVPTLSRFLSPDTLCSEQTGKTLIPRVLLGRSHGSLSTTVTKHPEKLVLLCRFMFLSTNPFCGGVWGSESSECEAEHRSSRKSQRYENRTETQDFSSLRKLKQRKRGKLFPLVAVLPPQ